MKYHKDKHGKSLEGLNGYKLKDSSGKRFQLVGTGLRFGIDDIVMLWDQDDKLTRRKESEIEIDKDAGIIWPYVALIAVLFLIFIYGRLST